MKNRKRLMMSPEEEQQALLQGTLEAAKSRIGNLLNVQALLSLGIPTMSSSSSSSGASASKSGNFSSSSTGRSTINFLEALSGGRGGGEVMSKSSSSMLAQVDDILSSITKNNASSSSTSPILLSSSPPLGSSSSNNLLSPLLAFNATTSTATTTSVLQELSAWDTWMDRLQSSMTNLRAATSNTTKFAIAAESMLKQATSRLESLLNEASTVVSPANVLGELIFKASQAVLMYNATTTMAPYTAFAAAGTAASEAAVLDTLDFAVTLVSVADRILRQGYVRGDPAAGEELSLLQQVPKVPGNDRALFDDYATAVEMNRYTAAINKAAEMGVLAGSIYDATPLRTLTMSHSIVASGVTSDVRWTITDSMANHEDFAPHHYHQDDNDDFTTANNKQQDPKSMEKQREHSKKQQDDKKGKIIAVRTIVIRGFDASDENVDREDLVTRICLARPKVIQVGGGSSTGSSTSSSSLSGNKASTSSSGNIMNKRTILVHSGLWDMAQAIYKDVKQYVEWSAPSHRIVITGHSIGGSIALLVLFLMTMDRGVDFVKRKVVRVYTFGSPPVAAIPDLLENNINIKNNMTFGDNNDANNRDDILEAFGLPSEMVHSYVQPWDPIVRLFTKEDPLYPLIGDVGDEWDGVTPWPKGPPRTLRPIIKTIFESWNGWPRFRDEALGNLGTQDYSSVGIQFVLLPDPARYLADRFLSINLAVPPVHTVLRISPRELLPSLVQNFPLDVFEISFIPQALRSFIHHFFPAYGTPFADYVRLLKQASKGSTVKGGGLGIPAASTTAPLQNEKLTTTTTTASTVPRTDEDVLMMQDKARRASLSAAATLADGEQDNENSRDDAFGWMRAAPWLVQQKDEQG
jgi:Lipase (class 3)